MNPLEQKIVNLAARFANEYHCAKCKLPLTIIHMEGEILAGCPQCGRNSRISLKSNRVVEDGLNAELRGEDPFPES